MIIYPFDIINAWGLFPQVTYFMSTLLGIFFPPLLATPSLKGLTKIPYNSTKNVKYGVSRELNFRWSILR
jgi:hypothetical protein